MVDTNDKECVPYPYKCHGCNMDMMWKVPKQDLESGKVDKHPRSYTIKHSDIHASLGCNAYCLPDISKEKKKKKEEDKIDINKNREIYNEKFFENVKFSNIKGLDTEIQDIKEYIIRQKTFIKKKYAKRGYKIGKGILLVGPPGVSKTDLIKATYNEMMANEPSTKAVIIKLRDLIKSNDVGENLQSIHDNFKYANKFEEDPNVSTVFVILDEFEAISQDRGTTKGVNERNITLGIMDEIDNLGEKCIVMAASNHAIQMDSALLRGGRIDKLIPITLPNKKARKDIFEYHYNNIQAPKDNNIDTEKIAELLEGYTGADIMTMCRDLSADIDYRIDNGDVTAILTMEMIEQDIKAGIHKTENRLISIKERKTDKRRISDDKINTLSEQQQQFIDNEINKMHTTGRNLVLHYVGTSRTHPRTDLIDLTVEEIARKDPVYYSKHIKTNLLVIQALRGEEIVLTDDDFMKGTYIKTETGKTEEPKKDEQKVEIDIIADYARQLVEIERKEEPKKEEPKKEELKIDKPKKVELTENHKKIAEIEKVVKERLKKLECGCIRYPDGNVDPCISHLQYPNTTVGEEEPTNEEKKAYHKREYAEIY